MGCWCLLPAPLDGKCKLVPAQGFSLQFWDHFKSSLCSKHEHFRSPLRHCDGWTNGLDLSLCREVGSERFSLVSSEKPLAKGVWLLYVLPRKARSCCCGGPQEGEAAES